MSYTILSFCGGGVRGLLSAVILKRLHAKRSSMLTKTNLLAGTSTGAGIISAMLNGQKPHDIVQTFFMEGENFYSKRQKKATAPAYSSELFIKSQKHMHHKTTLADISQRQSVLFTSFNVGSKNKPWVPILFNNLPNSPNAGTTIADAVVSSGSMPGMFGSYKGHVDGAFVHHDPTLAAMALAINSGVDLNDIVVIWIGTGFMPQWIASKTGSWGAKQWQHGDGNPDNRLPALLVDGKESPILNISMNGTSTNLIAHLAKMMLPGRYACVNPKLDRYVPENESKKPVLDYLHKVGEKADLSEAEVLLDNWPAS